MTVVFISLKLQAYWGHFDDGLGLTSNSCYDSCCCGVVGGVDGGA